VKRGEIGIARQLARAGILFVAGYVYNIGGVLTGWAGHIFGGGSVFC